MKRLGRGVVPALVAVLAASACRKPAPSLPFTITVDSAVLRAGDPLTPSPIFDGVSVSLAGVRGETLGVLVAFREPPVAPPILRADAAGLAVTASALEMVTVTEPSTRLFGPSRGAGQYPDRVVPIGSAGVATQFLFEISIAADAPAGIRRATLEVGGREIAIELEVVPVQIRLDRSPLVWVWYLAAEVARAHGVAAGSGPELLAIELRYRQLLLDHGALLATDPSVDELEARRELILPSALYWPVRIRSSDPAELARRARTVIDFFAPLAQTPFTIPIDEPATEEARAAVVANGRVLRAAGAGPGKLLHVVTDAPRSIYGDVVDVFLSPRGVAPREPGNATPHWTYNGRPPSAASLVIDGDGGSLRSWGWIAFRYDVELWYAWEGLYWTDRYNLRDPAARPTDFSATSISFDERHRGGSDFGNGDGVLVYPGFVPSLRLKALRRGLQDRLLLLKLVACGGGAEARSIARTTVPRALGEGTGAPLWPLTDSGWHRARAAVLDAIKARCPAE